jgi:hypothetical protein
MIFGHLCLSIWLFGIYQARLTFISVHLRLIVDFQNTFLELILLERKISRFCAKVGPLRG